MDGVFPNIFHGERSELREKYGIAQFVEEEEYAWLALAESQHRLRRLND